MFFRCPSIQAHCSEAVIYLHFGTPKIMNFPFGINGKYIIFRLVGWLVGCFGLNGPLRQYFSLYRAVSQREEERKEK